RVELDRPALRDGDERLRREQEDIRHDAEVDIERAQRVLRLGAGVVRELEELDALLLRRKTQRVGPRPRLFRSAEHGGDVSAALEEGIEDGLAEILLPDDRDAHGATIARSRFRMQHKGARALVSP